MATEEQSGTMRASYGKRLDGLKAEIRNSGTLPKLN